MPGWRLSLRTAAAHVIRHLPPEIKRAVKAALLQVIAHPSSGEPLHGELAGLWKYRVRRYRVVYKVDRTAKSVEIVAVGRRRSIYEEVANLLSREKK
jgi:mRNA interferase RelE/StbE